MNNDAFDAPTAPTRGPAGGWEAEERRLQLQRDVARAWASAVRWGLVGAIAILLALAWWFRWDVQPAQRSEGGAAYIVDRITGAVYFARQEDATVVTKDPPATGR